MRLFLEEYGLVIFIAVLSLFLISIFSVYLHRASNGNLTANYRDTKLKMNVNEVVQNGVK